MTNFLFEDLENGGYFFVQCYTVDEAYEILMDNEFDPEQVVLLDEVDDAVAEVMGYDTY